MVLLTNTLVSGPYRFRLKARGDYGKKEGKTLCSRHHAGRIGMAVAADGQNAGHSRGIAWRAGSG